LVTGISDSALRRWSCGGRIDSFRSKYLAENLQAGNEIIVTQSRIALKNLLLGPSLSEKINDDPLEKFLSVHSSFT
jgi:hypothetical protein